MSYNRHLKMDAKPYDAEVEYLEVSKAGGRAYINTGYIPNGLDNDFNIIYMFNGYEFIDSNPAVFGTFSEEAEPIYNLNIARAQSRLMIYNGFNWVENTSFKGIPQIPFNTGIKTEIGSFADGSYSVNGTYFESGHPNFNNNENFEPLYVFANRVIESYFIGRIYSLKWWKAKKLTLDLIPVRIGDEGCLYDKVSGKVFHNQGEGRFILGPDKN